MDWLAENAIIGLGPFAITCMYGKNSLISDSRFVEKMGVSLILESWRFRIYALSEFWEFKNEIALQQFNQEYKLNGKNTSCPKNGIIVPSKNISGRNFGITKWSKRVSQILESVLI